MHLRSILLIILLAALLSAPLAAASTPSLSQRESGYLGSLEGIKHLQNSDGGFGVPVQVEAGDGNFTNITAPERASFVQTVLVVHLLVTEETDRLETWKNWEGVPTSLARSNATTALKWLQDYEKEHEKGLTPGDHALLALAYHELGDHENAHELVSELLDQEAQGDSRMGAQDLAQLLFVQEHAGFGFNTTQNATIDDLDERLAGMTLSAPTLVAWALLAQPENGDRRADLANRLDGDMSLDLRALGAWALAQSGGADVTTEDAILSVYGHQPEDGSLAEVYLLFAERTAHPHFSPHIDLSTGGSVFGAGSQAPTGESEPVQEPEASPDPAPGPVSEPEPTRAFPVPAWLMMGVLLAALAVLVVAGLAYGLKREDLDGPRKDIFDYIDSHPGEHFSKIRRDLGLAPGTFQHHLSVLESGGWITSYKDARYKRYFVNGNRYKQMIAGYQYKQKFAALANGTTRDLVQLVRDHPGVTQKEVALRLNLHASTVNWHANRLKQAGILRPERQGREVRYHVDQDLVKKMMQHANN